MLGAIVLAAVFALAGVLIQLGVFGANHHAISNKALLCWGLAVVALIAASFARPQKDR
jgi:hypothetical protein